ncbi:MAG: nitroreductase family protein [Burkholderiaceae bacterium]|nr:nitroreductase family protein [Burkholderiaceae bacterium]
MSSIPANPGALAGARSRRADFPVSVQFIDRWSPRAFTDEAMTEADVLGVLEAARWAPSASNAQPWRFCYSLRGDAHWGGYLGVLNDTNQRWVKRAAALVVVLSSRYIVAPSGEASVSRTHSFDAGCAWGFMALQAHLSGWAAHAMAGFDAERLRALLGVPLAFNIEAVVALGRQGTVDLLPMALQPRELPSQRRPLADSVSAGRFSGA